MDMTKEINAAADWWAQCLRQKHEGTADVASVDVLYRSLVDAHVTPLPEERIEEFKMIFKSCLFVECNINNGKAWINTDSGTEESKDAEILCLSAHMVQIDYVNLRFPLKCWMRIEPGRIIVQPGKTQPEVQIYPVVTSTEED